MKTTDYRRLDNGLITAGLSILDLQSSIFDFDCSVLSTRYSVLVLLCVSAVSFVSLPSCTSRPSWSNSLSSFEPPQDDPEPCRMGHHEKHEGHEVWLTVRAKNARVTKIVLRSLWLHFLSVPSWRSLRRRSGYALPLCSSLRGIPTRPRLSCSPEALFHRASQFFLDSIIRNSTEQFKRERFISETGRRNSETFLYLNTSNYSPIGQICSSFRVNGEHSLNATY